MQTRQTIDGDTDIMEHSAEGILRDLSEGQHVLTYFQDGIHNEMRIDVSGEEIIVTRNWKQENQFHYKQNKQLHRYSLSILTYPHSYEWNYRH